MCSKKLVIDTSVARSAGGEQATYPTSINCRDTLKIVLKAGHFLVVTPDLLAEWKKHRSQFAADWLVQMYARKRVVRLNELPTITEKLQKLRHISDDARAAMLKDCLLIDAALASDKTILSLDSTVRDYFAGACITLGEIKLVIWRHPDEPNILIWLENGATPDKQFRLEAYQTVPDSD
jgi:hypothetical protein